MVALEPHTVDYNLFGPWGGPWGVLGGLGGSWGPWGGLGAPKWVRGLISSQINMALQFLGILLAI